MNMHPTSCAKGRPTPLFALLSLCALAPACAYNPPDSDDAIVEDDSADESSTGDVSGDSGDDDSQPDPDPDDSAGETSDGGSTGDMGASCDPETHACNELAPDGWSGPGAIVISDDLEASGCGGTYGETALTAYADLHADEASCTCSCGDPAGGSCNGTGSIQHFPKANYPNPYWQNIQECAIPADDAFVFSAGAVYDFSAGQPGRVLTDANVTASGGDCAPELTTDFPEPAFGLRIDACLPTDVQDDCNEYEACQPKTTAPFEATCVWQPGDLECPAGTPYTERTVYHQSFTDERACDSCSCSNPQGSCNPEITLWRIGGTNLLPADGSCTDLDASYTGVSFDPGDPDWDACTPSGGELFGEVLPTEPITFCCMA